MHLINYCAASLTLLIIFLQKVHAGKVVLTNSGPVRGLTNEILDVQVDAYLGIPFATPPVGDLRFRKPISARPWDDVLDATVKAPPCYQNASDNYYYMPKIENMTEDCLYLNIWTPRSNSVKPKAVLVWIYGGAFTIGSSDMEQYDGGLMAAYGDVVVVSFNYRIGFFGYFYSSLNEASGNMGMYDQIMALEWVKENIEFFGGNPDLITLLGESAGSMSISGHLISPLTRHLFKRVIMHSGAGVHPLSFDANTSQLKVSNTMARITKCANDTVSLMTDPRTVVKCLKNLPPIEITIAEGILRKSNPLTVFPIYGDAYLPEEITGEISRGDYKNTEALVGVNSEEGPFFLTLTLPEYFGVYGQNGTENLKKRFAHSLIKTMYNTVKQNHTKEIADFYINNIKNITSSSLRKAIHQSLGDYTITCGALFFADLYSRKKDNVYFFKFNKRPSIGVTADWMDTTHFDEIPFLFGDPLRHKENYTEEEILISRRLIDRWLNFAKTGNPDIPGELRWPSYSYEYPVYLDINDEESIRLRPVKKRCEFWRERFHSQMDTANMAEALVEDMNSATSISHTFHIILFSIFFSMNIF